MTTHTPGPWHVGEVRYAGRAVLVEHDGRGFVAEVQTPVCGNELDEEAAFATARLIAAAPDLLAALKAVTDGMDMAGGDGYGMSECPWCHKDDFNAEHHSDCELLAARAAIEKAEGR